MKSTRVFPWLVCVMVPALTAGALRAAEGLTKVLFDVTADGAEKRLVPEYNCKDVVSFARSTDPDHPGVILTVQPGPQGYPGARLQPEGAATFDLSAFGHVSVRVTNTGTKTSVLGVRVDNAGDWHDAPWNTENLWLAPGKSGTVTVIFGYQYGLHPGFALNPAAVTSIMLLTTKSDVVQSFRIESFEAGGRAGETPPVDPAAVRIKPKAGVILGPGATLDPATQIAVAGGAKAELAAGAAPTLGLSFPAANGAVTLKPAMGRWDLRYATEVRVKLKNEGALPATASVQVVSNGGPTDLVTAVAIASGAEQEIVVPFTPAKPWLLNPIPPGKVWHSPYDGPGSVKGTGTTLTSDTVSAIRISSGAAATLRVTSVTTPVTPAEIPDWLGKRPPVPQAEADNWSVTLDEKFPGNAIDSKTWSVHGNNFYDDSHYSRDEVIVGDGICRLRYEKKTGFHNDDPKQKQSPYASGYLESYDHWTQRYGYFEAKVKLPLAPGLWPAFWTVPDRGPQAGIWWKRGSTSDGGMEVDIMEHLTRWGPFRYNIAMHWDGYQKEHKVTGMVAYVQPDKDGWITPGVLWTPGSLIYYCNGKEIGRWEDPRVCSVQSYIIFNIPHGGWDNNGIDDKQLPADFQVQYVRVWQRKDLASPADGHHEPTPPATEPAAP